MSDKDIVALAKMLGLPVTHYSMDNRPEPPIVRKPRVDAFDSKCYRDFRDKWFDNNPSANEPRYHMDSNSNVEPDASDTVNNQGPVKESTGDAEQLKEALMRQIEETNRMNKMYVDATKKIAYLENENAAFKAQLEKFYKIQSIMNGNG